MAVDWVQLAGVGEMVVVVWRAIVNMGLIKCV